MRGVQVQMDYAGRGRPAGTRRVHPLGLVMKGSVWYLIGDTENGLRTFRVGRVRGVEPTDEPVERPPGFDLAETWRSIAVGIDERRASFKAVVKAQPNALPWLKGTFGKRLKVLRTLTDGVVEAEVRGHSAHVLASELAGFGGHAEVIRPAELREELGRLAGELTHLYEPPRS